MRLPPSTAHPTLDALLEATRNHVMTPAERREQRRSWVIGQMMLSHPAMTREEVVAIMDKLEAEGRA